jgi:pimeloyl-ACP methyl ester carboxylesterase
VFDAYRFLIDNYESDDLLYLFGFSRGAFTARSLAGLIRNSGILRRENADQVRAAMAQLSVDSFSDAEWATQRQRHVHGDDQIRMLYDQMRGLKDSYDDMAFTPPLLGTIAARTLVVHGDRDPLYPVELAIEIYRSIPKSALWVVPNGGHGPIFGPLAAPFVDTALHFLRTE